MLYGARLEATIRTALSTPLLFLALTAGLYGCAKPAISGAPTPFLVPETANPDVLWMVRPVTTERDGEGQVTLWGLFACYRKAEPGPPQCFLAETAGTKEALVWPDTPGKYRMRLKD